MSERVSFCWSCCLAKSGKMSERMSAIFWASSNGQMNGSGKTERSESGLSDWRGRGCSFGGQRERGGRSG